MRPPTVVHSEADVKDERSSAHRERTDPHRLFYLPAPLIPPPPPSRSAARDVLATPQLRKSIFQSLSRSDVAKMMRVDRRCLREGAEVLYQYVSGRRVLFHLDKRYPRQRMYLDAVRYVDARPRVVPTSARCRLGLDERRGGYVESDIESDSEWDIDSDKESSDGEEGYARRRRPHHLQNLSKLAHPQYRARSFSLGDLVTPLRRKLPNLKQISMGAEYRYFGDDSWTVHIGSSPVAAKPSWFDKPPTVGYINLIRTLKFSLSGLPPWLSPSPAPSPEYDLLERFDLYLYLPSKPSGVERVPKHGEWRFALRETMRFGNLYRAVNFGPLEVDLDIITGLLQQQRQCGHTDRLQYINDPFIAGWTTSQFQRFGYFASSLVILILCKENDFRENDVGTSFTDLPNLISIIRRDLPNLRTLQLPLAGVETAERDCRPMLSAKDYDQEGSVVALTIVTETCATRLVNVPRCLGSMCTPDAEIDFPMIPGWHLAEATMFHRYIRAQLPVRRYYLHTADLAALGVERATDIFSLRYTSYDSPSHLHKLDLSADADVAKSEGENAMKGIMEGLEKGVLNHAAAIKIIQGW